MEYMPETSLSKIFHKIKINHLCTAALSGLTFIKPPSWNGIHTVSSSSCEYFYHIVKSYFEQSPEFTKRHPELAVSH